MRTQLIERTQSGRVRLNHDENCPRAFVPFLITNDIRGVVLVVFPRVLCNI